eukprot:375651-Amphidinium_carterae.1
MKSFWHTTFQCCGVGPPWVEATTRSHGTRIWATKAVSVKYGNLWMSSLWASAQSYPRTLTTMAYLTLQQQARMTTPLH